MKKENSMKRRELFIRFKDIPPHETSRVHGGDTGVVGVEAGVSCYHCVQDGVMYRIVLPALDEGILYDLLSFTDKLKKEEYPCYLIEAEQVGVGTFGEPVVRNIITITLLERVNMHYEKPRTRFDRTNHQLVKKGESAVPLIISDMGHMRANDLVSKMMLLLMEQPEYSKIEGEDMRRYVEDAQDYLKHVIPEIKAYVATKQKAKLYVNAESTIKSLEDRNAELERRLKTHRRQYNALIDRFDVIGKNIESLAKSIILNSSKKREIISYCKMLHNPHTSPFKSK